MEFEIGSHKYRTGKLPVMKQFHIVRRLVPVLLSMGQAAAAIDENAPAEAESPEELSVSVRKVLQRVMVNGLAPVADALANLSDADSEFIINACLDVTSREAEPGKWAPVRIQQGLMYQDIDLPGLMKIAFIVIQENLGNFFPGQFQGSSTGTAAPT